jgi:hypothetical protein
MFDHEKKYDQDEITYVRSRTKVLNPETSLHKIHRMELATPRDVSDQHRTVLAAVRFIEAGKTKVNPAAYPCDRQPWHGIHAWESQTAHAVEPEVTAVNGNIVVLDMAAPDTEESDNTKFLRLFD